eukprot:TRINITY_DN171_c2_g1_i3.p1 TRINITY_DN171_c2_g1~~TRINITY_DN171_c2_g1_i3.p1  ORF type:complete len:1111 (+),score=146.06 TRINITY_DN171_c2_g1_i3:105-3437(+)
MSKPSVAALVMVALVTVEGHCHRGRRYSRARYVFPQDLACDVACANPEPGDAYGTCLECLDNNAGETMQLPLSYNRDFYAVQFNPTIDLIDGFCGQRPLHPTEGVNLTEHPSGWRPVVDSDGTTRYTGCEVTHDFLGLGTVSYQSHAYVKEALRALPRAQNHGMITRRNDLGFTIMHSFFFDKVDPPRTFVGSNLNQHKAIRPVLDGIFGACDAACAATMSASAAEFMASRDVLTLQHDLAAWVHVELFKRAFPGEPNPFDADEFAVVQVKFKLVQVSQLVPDFLTHLLAGQVKATLLKYHELLKPLVQKHYGAQVENEDCSPTPGGCVEQLTAAVLEALLIAGGFSVPMALNTALWVLQTDTQPYGDTFPQNHKLDTSNPLPFFYEVLRFFPPVLSIPWRAEEGVEYPQWQGNLVLLGLGLASRDPNVWGADAHKFRVRSMSEYHEHFVNFAEPAVDDTVAGGRMNRKCPGKALALALGKAWLKNWKQSEWQVVGSPATYKYMSPYIGSYVLARSHAAHTVTNSPASPNPLLAVPFGWGEYMLQLLGGLQDPQLSAARALVDGFRFDLTQRAYVGIYADTYAHLPPIPPSSVRPPWLFGELPMLPSGFAGVHVPMHDEIFPSPFTIEETQLAMALTQKLPFPDTADEAGQYHEWEHPETVVGGMLSGIVDDGRVLVPWGQEKHTDKGFSAVVFQGIGQHRVEKVRRGDRHARSAVYASYLNFAEDLEVRPGFAKYGADAYFDKHGQVTHIRRGGQTYHPSNPGWAAYRSSNMTRRECRAVRGWRECDQTGSSLVCRCTVPAKLGFKAAKLAFLGTLFAVVTAVDHLFGVHLTYANSLVISNVAELPVEHPLRVLLNPFTFGTAAVNYAVARSLTSELGLLQRTTSLSTQGLWDLFAFARTEAAGVSWKSPLERFQAQGFGPDDLHLPLHEDATDFYGVVKQFVHSFVTAHWDYTSNTCRSDEHVKKWWTRMSSMAPLHDLPAAVTCENLEQVIAVAIFYVSAMHTHVGAVTGEVLDPCHLPMAWREGEPCGPPRTAHAGAVLIASTSQNHPKLLGDYTHLFDDEGDKQLWRDFQVNLVEYGKRVDARNAQRTRPFKGFHLSHIEISTAV